MLTFECPAASRTSASVRPPARATAEFVSNHWPLIELIAVELLEHITLGMEELDLILDIYHGEATEEDLSEYRNSFVH
jgi:hypothetical protein